MKKKVSTLLLAFCLLLTLPAHAAQEAGFTRSRVYGGEFADLTPESPFYSNVAALYEYGLSNGKDDGRPSFLPDASGASTGPAARRPPWPTAGKPPRQPWRICVISRRRARWTWDL